MVVNTELTVNGSVFNRAKNISLQRSVGDNNASSRLTISLDNWDGIDKNTFLSGNEVILKADKDAAATTKLFTGIVSEISYDGKDSNKEDITITCRDYTALMQKTTIEPEVYTNQEISVIVSDVFDKYKPVSTMTRTNVNVTGVTLPRIVFKQTNLFDSIKQLAELADFVFWVDEDKDLHFESKGSTDSGVTLNSTNVKKSNFKISVETVRNKIFVYGNRILVKHPTEVIPTDGGSVYTLQDKPHNTQISITGTTLNGDVFRITESDPGSPANYLVNFEDKQIVFVSGAALGYNSIPASGGSFVADYQVSRPIVKLVEDGPSQVAYGIRTEVIIDNNILDPDTAKEIAKNKIKLLKDPKRQGNIEVSGIVNLQPSNTVVVNLPNENVVSERFEILECIYDFDADSVNKDEILKVKVNKHIRDVTDVLQELILSVKRLHAADIDTTSVLTRYMLTTGSFGLRVSGWTASTRTYGNEFRLSSTSNGKLGSPQLGYNGSQILLGSIPLEDYVVQASGGYF